MENFELPSFVNALKTVDAESIQSYGHSQQFSRNMISNS